VVTATFAVPCDGVMIAVGFAVSGVAVAAVVKPIVKLPSVLPDQSQIFCKRSV